MSSSTGIVGLMLLTWFTFFVDTKTQLQHSQEENNIIEYNRIQYHVAV